MCVDCLLCGYMGFFLVYVKFGFFVCFAAMIGPMVLNHVWNIRMHCLSVIFMCDESLEETSSLSAIVYSVHNPKFFSHFFM